MSAVAPLLELDDFLYAFGDDWSIYCGDILTVAPLLKPNNIAMIATSPPYYRLRTYGLMPSDWPDIEYVPMAGLGPVKIPAWTGCLGEEDDPLAYVGHLVHVFRLLRPALRDDGVVFLNLGDTYAAERAYQVVDNKQRSIGNSFRMKVPDGLKSKDLIFIPARVFLALQADGWYGRSDIIHYRRNAMPEGGIDDRPVRSHEYIFLLSKSRRYFYSWYHTLDEASWERWGNQTQKKRAAKGGWVPEKDKEDLTHRIYKRRRDVWDIPTEPYGGGHTAAFSRKLTELMVLAGSSPFACEVCGAPFEPLIENAKKDQAVPLRSGEWEDEANKKGIISGGGLGGRKRIGASRKNDTEKRPEYVFNGWRPTCRCEGVRGEGKQVVLDPFMGSGTVLEVATRLNRRAIGIELNPAFCEMAIERITTSTWKPSVNHMGSLQKPIGDVTAE